jgi:hypothetical protein
MAELVTLIVSNPYAVLVIILSVIAAIGFLIFLWGFSGYILAHGDTEHQQHARVQIVSGFSLLLSIAILWETLRWIGSLFT